MTSPNEDCLQPTDLCDFDRQPEIKAKALELTRGCRTKEETFQRLFAFVKELAQRLGPAGAQQDHVACEVWLGEWQACDPSRDTPLERGMSALGLPLERERTSSQPVFSMTLASFDRWARERQEHRRFRDNR